MHICIYIPIHAYMSSFLQGDRCDHRHQLAREYRGGKDLPPAPAPAGVRILRPGLRRRLGDGLLFPAGDCQSRSGRSRPGACPYIYVTSIYIDYNYVYRHIDIYR